MHTHTRTHTHMHTHTRMHAHTCTHTHTHAHTHTQEELLLACDEVRAAGEVMHQAASEFARDTFQSEKRDEMTKASRELLMSVTRLMVIADAVDVKKLLKTSNRVRSRKKTTYNGCHGTHIFKSIIVDSWLKTCTNKVDYDQLHGSVSLKPWLKLNLMCAGTSLIPKSTPSFLSPAVWVKEQNAGWGLAGN